MQRVLTLTLVLLLAAFPAVAAPPDAKVGDVDHVGLTVTDLDASTAFFEDSLGFEVVGRDEAYPAVFLGNGEFLITLWRATAPEKAVSFDRKNNVGLHHLAIRVGSFEALDAMHRRLVEAPGVKIEFAPEPLGGGPAKHMMLREPSGNRIELIHRPPEP